METTAQLPLWVQTVAALGPVLALTGVLVAAASIWWAARRERWWVRTRWALDCTRDPDWHTQRLGIAVFAALTVRAPSQDERHIVRAVTSALLGLAATRRPVSTLDPEDDAPTDVEQEGPDER